MARALEAAENERGSTNRTKAARAFPPSQQSKTVSREEKKRKTENEASKDVDRYDTIRYITILMTAKVLPLTALGICQNILEYGV